MTVEGDRISKGTEGRETGNTDDILGEPGRKQKEPKKRTMVPGRRKGNRGQGREQARGGSLGEGAGRGKNELKKKKREGEHWQSSQGDAG